MCDTYFPHLNIHVTTTSNADLNKQDSGIGTMPVVAGGLVQWMVKERALTERCDGCHSRKLSEGLDIHKLKASFEHPFSSTVLFLMGHYDDGKSLY